MPKVLVVDDSATLRKLVSGVLEREGYDVVVACDGEDALEALDAATTKPDLVLVDFVMPGMDGLELAFALRAQPEHADIPLVLMSARGEGAREQFLEASGAVDAITKPFETEALVAVVEHALGRGRSRPRAFTSSGRLPAAAPAEPGPSRGARASSPPGEPPALTGRIGVIPLAAVLQMLQLERKSGVLRCQGPELAVEVFLRDGLVDLVKAEGPAYEFRLGRFLVDRGVISAEEIDAIVERALADPDSDRELLAAARDGAASTLASPTVRDPGFFAEELTPPSLSVPASRRGRPLLGDLLLGSGRVSPEQLRDALARQSSELVYEMLRWPRGRFELRDGAPHPDAERARLGLPMAALVMEGFRRLDEWREIERGLGSFDEVLVRDDLALSALGDDALSRAETAVLASVDGARCVRDILKATAFPRFEACKVLAQLLEARLVRPRHGAR